MNPLLPLLALAFGTLSGTGKDAPAPKLLSETGLYAAPGKVDPANLAFSPQYPLWSDGAVKSRWLHLPKGGVIDGRNEDGWQFPVGTKVWKEFVFQGRKVETRLIWRTGAASWVFASYQWNEAQTDAVLVPASGLAEVAEIAKGLRHSIPSVADCQACHENSGTEVLGFSALQLSPDRDPKALHGEPLGPGMVTLKELVQRRLIQGVREDLLSRPPRIQAANPESRAILGYLSTNCGACHRGDAPIPELGLDFRHTGDVKPEGEPGLLTTLGQQSLFTLPGQAPVDAVLIVPGAPEKGTVPFRMASRRPASQMPPLGTVIADEEAVARIQAWIASLKPNPAAR